MDSGNALFRLPGLNEANDLKRADFVLSRMGKLGTFAMAVGARDLNAGPAALKSGADRARVKLLSANLTGKDGKPLFPASAITLVGGVKVGLIGVSPPGPIAGVPGVQGLPVIAAVASEAKSLKGKVDLVVVLAAVPYPDALQLSTALGDGVDLVLNSHDSRGAGAAQRAEKNYVLPSGERGRQLGKLELGLGGKGPFADLEEAAREAQMASMLQTQLAGLRTRLDAAKDPQAKKDLQASIASLDTSRKQHELAAAPAKGGGRTLKLTWIKL
ncbi:MAG: 5'-nucleotidase, partial [Myxococcaceae bacterium]